jgi:hypothetical protein
MYLQCISLFKSQFGFVRHILHRANVNAQKSPKAHKNAQNPPTRIAASPRPRVAASRPHPYRTTSAGSSIFTDDRGSSGSRAAAGSNSRASSRLTR